MSCSGRNETSPTARRGEARRRKGGHMWLSERKRGRGSDGALVGAATLEGETAGAYLDGERRDLAVFAPGGYCWRPAVGQELLVIKGADGPCVAGTRSGAVQPGEVLISAGSGGASILLKNDGTVELTGRVLVNGTPVEELGGGNGTGT